MHASKVITGALTVGALVLASMFAAAPASAATLPEGQKITVVERTSWQFFDASPVDAALTPVSPAPGVLPLGQYVEAVDVNDDGKGYGFATAFEEEEIEDCNEEEVFCSFLAPVGGWLFQADAKAGTLSGGIHALVPIGAGPDWVQADSCYAIDYSGGQILGACNIYGDPEAEGDWPSEDTAYIGYLDPATGRLAPLNTLVGEDFVELSAIAKNPKTGTIYGFEVLGGSTAVYVVTLDNQPLMGPGEEEWEITAADYDRDGTLWVSVYRPQIAARALSPGDQGLAIFDVASGTYPFDAAWPELEVWFNALTVWGKILPPTGPASPALPAVGAALALLAGTILAGVTVLRRKELKPEDGPAA